MSTVTETMPLERTPEAHLPPKLAEDLSELAEELLDKGDALDQLKWLTRAPTIGATALTASGLAGFNFGPELELALEYRHTPETAFLLTSGLVLAAGLVVARSIRPLARRRLANRMDALMETQEEVQEELFNGEPVEIYKIGKKKKERHLEIFWEGPPADYDLTSSALHQRLINLKGVAEATKASAVIIPSKVIDEFLHGVDQDLIDHTTRNRLLKTIKDKQHGEEAITIIHRDALDVVIENAEHAQVEEPLHTIMRLLHRFSPNDSALIGYYAGIKGDAVNAPSFERHLRRLVERQLFDSDTRINHFGVPEDDEFRDLPQAFTTASNSAEVDEEPTRQQTFLQGRASINHLGQPIIKWYRLPQTGQVEIGNLLTHLRTTINQLERLPSAAQVLARPRLIQLCHLAAWLTMHDQLTDVAADEGANYIQALSDQVGKAEAKQRQGLQRRIIDQTLGVKQNGRFRSFDKDIDLTEAKKFRRRRSLRALGMAGLIGVSIGFVGQGYSGAYGKFYNTTNPDNLQKYVGNPLFVGDNAVLNASYYYHEGVLNLISSTMRQFNPGYNPDEFNRLRIEGSQRMGDNVSDAKVGNVEQSPNRPEWFLTAHGMDTNGYWTERTYNDFEGDNVAWHGKYSYEGTPTSQTLTKDAYRAWFANHINEMPRLPSIEEFDLQQPHILVQRNISTPGPNGDYMENGNKSYEKFNAYTDDPPNYVVPVPVLNGAHIAAAHGADGPIRVFTYSDGQQALLVPRTHSDIQPLEYILAPGSTELPHARGPITYVADETPPGSKNYKFVTKPLPPDFFDAEWKQNLGQPLSDNPQTRLEQEEEYIEGFKYRLAPLKDDKVLDDSHAYVEAILSGHEAQCNTANTTLTISNPQILNYATGFLNHNTAKQNKAGKGYLSTGDAHAWAVDEQGQIYDATPTNDILPKEAEQFKENFNDTFKDVRKTRTDHARKVALLAGAAVLTTMVGWQRKRLARVPTTTQRIYAQGRMRTMTKRQLGVAYQSMNQAMYGADSNIDYQTQRTVSKRSRLNRRQLIGHFNEFAHHPQVSDIYQILSQSEQTTKQRQSRRSLRRAGRLLKLSRRQIKV